MPSATMTYANHLDCDAKAANARGNEREEAPGRRRGHPKAAGAREADRDKGKGAGCHDPSATGTGEKLEKLKADVEANSKLRTQEKAVMAAHADTNQQHLVEEKVLAKLRSDAEEKVLANVVVRQKRELRKAPG